uniref:protein-tyrosine-phosphatase n=1 Tax=Schizophyllum commune (strain H4-8 / FGSC 9210) TaxID=578458 RepID=D8PK49_SCHCM
MLQNPPPRLSAPPKRRGPPAPLFIETPSRNPAISRPPSESSASALTSDSDSHPFGATGTARKSSRNMKGLSLALPSAQSSSNSLQLPDAGGLKSAIPDFGRDKQRRPSVISLPSTANPLARNYRREEDGSPTVPYADGPIQILPGLWLGSEDNARDWKGLLERGIRSILNVAKEVSTPFEDSAVTQTLRSTASTPNFGETKFNRDPNSTYYPAHIPSGRPSMHYLKLQWSHGEKDLVETGFPTAMAFADAARARGEGLLVHCQCGVSRSATVIIAMVMRAASERLHWVPADVWALKDMNSAYDYVKSKSRWAGPNMSLIFQLREYEKQLSKEAGNISPCSVSSRSSALADEEWGRRRALLDLEEPEAPKKQEVITPAVRASMSEEAAALDKAMEDRIIARKSSQSSVASSTGAGPWRSRYGSGSQLGSFGFPRKHKRASSIASTTNGSILSEDLVEEDEEAELLGVGGRFDSINFERGRTPSNSGDEHTSATNSPDDDDHEDQRGFPSGSNVHLAPPPAGKRRMGRQPPSLSVPPSAPAWKSNFSFAAGPPPSATRSTFDLTPAAPATRHKRRPPSLSILPPVPSSPPVTPSRSEPPSRSPSRSRAPSTPMPPLRLRKRTLSRKPAPPPLHLRAQVPETPGRVRRPSQHSPEHSQTLFLFPPSPGCGTTPSAMTLTMMQGTPTPRPGPDSVPFPVMMSGTPRVETFRGKHGRTHSFIGIGVPPTPTTAFSKVDVRGIVG